MIYTIEKANLVATQLKKFTTGYAHHVVGQYANIDFWLEEVITAQRTIDAYRYRFNDMRDAQKEWVEKHDTQVFSYCHICRGKCELIGDNPLPPSPPKRMSSAVLDTTRKELVNAMYYFLTRCYRMGLLNDIQLKQKCDRIGTSIDPSDLET
ncbi:hypothetical protein GCM10011344_34180 [Dokdonia pacifica]|uniref:Uncharacterized protein n=1 Tax=Dokdonia pacifica TaxID=1627892 RepID=A0A239BAA2_9FLAO|nr:hypothetical protein [Dokdonia pacifica]GGG30399.1 hypothetical protein GCM10011344_34180 [Dokdonia pacifica]SNS04925.1 hypothetical protein SAMN06265376_10637 [Dokdonia pacifica]